MANLIECVGVNKQYSKNFFALWDVSLSVEEPKIYGLIGKNGAGKTTLLRILAGFYYPTGGSVKVMGENPCTSFLARQNSILIDDTMYFPPTMRLKDIVGEYKFLYPNMNDVRAFELMEYFKLPADKRHNKLSKGMKSTFNVIIGLCANSLITLMDEPTTGMDPEVRKDFYKLVLNEFMANPRVIMISSHMVDEMEDILSDAILVKESRIIENADTDSIRMKGYRLFGTKADILPIIRDSKIYKYSIMGDKLQVDIYGDFEADFKSKMEGSGISCENLSLNDVTIYMCSNNVIDISELDNQYESRVKVSGIDKFYSEV